MDLIEICKDKRNELGYSYGKIAQETNLAPSTVASFFRDSAKSPSTNTAGPICRVLGISMDAVYEIYAAGMDAHEVERIRAEHAALAAEFALSQKQALRESMEAGKHIEETERIAEMERQKAESAMSTINGLRNALYGMIALCILLAAALLVLIAKL